MKGSASCDPEMRGGSDGCENLLSREINVCTCLFIFLFVSLHYENLTKIF